MEDTKYGRISDPLNINIPVGEVFKIEQMGIGTRIANGETFSLRQVQWNRWRPPVDVMEEAIDTCVGLLANQFEGVAGWQIMETLYYSQFAINAQLSAANPNGFITMGLVLGHDILACGAAACESPASPIKPGFFPEITQNNVEQMLKNFKNRPEDAAIGLRCARHILTHENPEAKWRAGTFRVDMEESRLTLRECFADIIWAINDHILPIGTDIDPNDEKWYAGY